MLLRKRVEEVEMGVNDPEGRVQASLEGMKALPGDQRERCLSVLGTVLDEQLMFGEPGLSSDALQPLFGVYWPDSPLTETIERLAGWGLLNRRSGSTCSVPQTHCRTLPAGLEKALLAQTFHTAPGVTEFCQLLDGFARYCQKELKVNLAENKQSPEVWGGRVYAVSGKSHYLMLRPHPLHLRPHPEACILMLCRLPDAGAGPMAEQFARSRSLRDRLALYDLDRCEKFNITRSEVFVFFERYLRRVHGLRIAPAPSLTQSLLDSGLLSFEMG
jgi:hypothetical protein